MLPDSLKLKELYTMKSVFGGGIQQRMLNAVEWWLLLQTPVPLVVLHHNIKRRLVRDLMIVLVPPVLLVLHHNIKQQLVRQLPIVFVLHVLVTVKMAVPPMVQFVLQVHLLN